MQASSKAESLGLNLHFCILDSRINQNYIHTFIYKNFECHVGASSILMYLMYFE